MARTFLIGELEITDATWVPAYAAAVTPMVERYGGRYLARTPRVEALEGEWTEGRIAVVLEFPSRDRATAFYESAEYRPWLDERLAGSRMRLLLVEGEDVVGDAGDLG